MSEEVPEGDAELGTGQQQAEEGVAALAAPIGVGSAGDLAFDHVRPQIALGAVGVQRQLRTVQHPQQLVLVGMQPFQQAVERGEPGAPPEDPVETGAQRRPPTGVRIAAVGLEIGVEPPDQGAQALLSGVLLVGEGVELVDQALGMDPACDRLSPGKEDDVKTI